MYVQWKVLAAAAALFCCAAGCTRTQERAGAAEAPPVPVRVAKPVRVQRAAFVAVSGTVEAQDSIELAFQVAGRVRRVAVDEGQPVARGQVLAEIDPTDYRYGLQAAEAQARMAKANLDKARNGTRPEELEQARAAFERAQDEYNRYRQLYDRKSLAPADFAKVEAAYKAARAQYEMAQNGARAEDRAAAQAAVQQAEAQVGVNSKRVADTRLTAPQAGIVARRLIDAGEMVGAGIPVLAIMNMNPARVRAGVPESDVSGIRPGQAAKVTIPALGGREFAGKVELAGIAADPNSRTFAVKIIVANPGNILRAGMIAEARIEKPERIDVLTVPGNIIVRDAQGATLVYVYYPDRARVYARRVEAGGVQGQDVEIRSGLTGNELVVVAGQQKLREGAAVEVLR